MDKETSDSCTVPKRQKMNEYSTPGWNPEPPNGFISENTEFSAFSVTSCPHVVAYLNVKTMEDILEDEEKQKESSIVKMSPVTIDFSGGLTRKSAAAARVATKYGWQTFSVDNGAGGNVIIMLPNPHDPQDFAKAYDLMIVKYLGKGSYGKAESCLLGKKLLTLKTIELNENLEEISLGSIISRETCTEVSQSFNTTRNAWAMNSFIPQLMAKQVNSFKISSLIMCALMISRDDSDSSETLNQIKTWCMTTEFVIEKKQMRV